MCGSDHVLSNCYEQNVYKMEKNEKMNNKK